MGLFDRLRAMVGLGPVIEQRAAGKPDPKPTVGTLPLSIQIQRIGGGLTPQAISAIIIEADGGMMYRLMDLANEARQKDGHLQCVLGTRENALAGLEWTCSAPMATRGKGKGQPLARDRKVADWCTDALRQAIVPAHANSEISGFTDLIAHLTGGAYYGYAVSETLLTKRSGLLVPLGWSRLASRRFRFNQNTGRLEHYDQYASAEGVDLMKVYPGKFIQHQPRINGDVPCREGLVRVLMWAALFRNWDIRDWMTLAELAWKPWRTGEYVKGASEEDIDALRAVLDAMSSSGVAVLPETAKVKVEWPRSPPAQNSNHKELADFMGAEMSKAVLGQTLTTDQGSRGSQSLGKVHNEIRKDILEYDARAVASTLRRHLIAPLVRMNFGDDVAIPEFRFLTEDATDLEIFSKAIVNLRTAGKRIPAKWVEDKCGMPEVKDGEELLGAAEKPKADEPVEPAPEPAPDDAPAEDNAQPDEAV